MEMILAIMSLVHSNVLDSFVLICSGHSCLCLVRMCCIRVEMILAVKSLVSQNMLHSFVWKCFWQSCLLVNRMCCIHLCGNVPG